MTRKKGRGPPISRSWQPRSLVVVTKIEEKEDDNQHEDHN